MKHCLKYYTPIISSLLLSSCFVSERVVSTRESKNPELYTRTTGVLIKPIIADLEIATERKTIVYKADLNISLAQHRANATQLFMETHKCDYVVDAQFARTSQTKNGKLKEIEFVLTGFPATYKKLYQVDSIPKSILEYNAIHLPVERNVYITKSSLSRSGSMFGIEYGPGLSYGTFGMMQLDYAPRWDGMHYYLGIESYRIGPGSSWGEVRFTETSNNVNIPKKASTYALTALSLGIFKDQEVTQRFSVRGSVGINYLGIQFNQSIIDPIRKTQYDGASVLGLRLGTALNFNISEHFSFILKTHVNLGLRNNILQSGETRTSINNIDIENAPAINTGLGVRFWF